MPGNEKNSAPSPLSEPQPTTPPGQGFLAWPVITDPAHWDADVALLGIPQSEPYPGDACPNDQSRAPDAIRAQSAQVSDGPAHWDFDHDAPVEDCLPPRCIDIGNVVCPDADWAGHAARVEAVARRLWAGSALLLAFGGDHGVTIPLLRALTVVGEPVHIVHVDAHLDWRDEVRGVRGGYSSPLRRASELPFVKGMTQIGMDVVEIAPSMDFANALSCITAGRLVMNLLGAVFRPGRTSGAATE